jgi:hypothetical protein
MTKTYWFLGIVLLILLTACSQKIDSETIPTIDQSILPESDNQDATVTPQPERHDPTITETETVIVEQTKPSVTPRLTETDQPVVETHDCGDPFEGESVRFPTQYWKTNFCFHSVPYAEIFSGGPPPDGIPPIDNPKFESVIAADEWLKDREPVIIFQEGDDVRAYPLQIMIWHEIVNDTVNDLPVVVTFCPLCNTALVFERPIIHGDLLTFGTSGNLRNSDLVMYDRQTESWWQQFSGEAIVGDLTGTQLTFLPAAIISWGDFKSQNPEGQVLSLDTGFNRSYGSNPYVGYDDVSQSPFLFSGPLDDRMRPMERVLGILLPTGTDVAYTFDRLSDEKVINDFLDDTPIVAFWKAGTASALDTSTISSGNDVGSTGVFLSTLDGESLTFIRNNDGTFQDEQTFSTWHITGIAEAGPLKGKQLTSLPHHDTFWFAWAAFANTENSEGINED